MPARNSRPASLLTALCVGLLLVLIGSSSARANPTSWGTAGASYSGGVLCTLDDGSRVPMAQWQVDGQDAFATADVVGTAASDGPAPVGETLALMVAGQGGLDERAIAVLAELLARDGNGSPAQTAEVSVAVADAFGSGGVQTQCLGQHGTSASDLAALRAEAERYAGPYSVSTSTSAPARPGTAVPVSVTVRSATGVPVPGVEVGVSGAGQSVTATTTAAGVATVLLTTPTVASTALTVSVVQHTSLLFAAGTPGAIALGPSSTALATTTLNADLHPHPALRVDVGGGLITEHSVLTPTARVSGTYGFAGSGTVTLAGPSAPAADGSCSSLPASAFAAAPNAWSQTFSFTGDGSEPVGSSPPLAAGCYVAGGSLTVTGVSPVATASAPFQDAAIVDVARIAVRRSAVPVLALPGKVATTVTVDGADDASVSSTATVFGPVAPRSGRCESVQWAGAPVLGTVASAPHQPADGDARAVVLRTPSMSEVGCYAVRARTTVRRDGRALTLQPTVGAAGTVVLVVRPSFTLTDDTYDTTRGVPMAGRVTVNGTYQYPAMLSVRLRSAAPHFDGCRTASFATRASGATATTRTTGDGTFTFHTATPTANTCYAVEASLQMVDAAGVRVDGPAPAQATIFLAGQRADTAHAPDVLHQPGTTLRATVTVLGSALLMLVLAVTAMVGVAVRYRVAVTAWNGALEFDE